MEASDLFIRAFSNSGTICGDCACGVTHFASFSNNGNFDEGELEELRRKAAADPAHYREHDCSSLTIIHIDGKQFIEGCECGKLKVYEDWIWAYREQIAKYLMTRLTHQLTTVQRTLGYLETHERLRHNGCAIPDEP